MSVWFLISPVMLVILIVLGILLVWRVWKRKKEGIEKEPDYKAFFIIGITFLGAGIVFMITINPGFLGFTIFGLFWMIFGLVNKDKWVKKI